VFSLAGAVGAAATFVVMPVAGVVSAAPTGATRFEVIAPARVADTRLPDCTCTVLDRETIRVQIAGRDGVPADATAAALTVTVAGATAGGYATVWPSGTPRRETSTLNWSAGETRANGTIVPLGTGGAIDVYVSGSLARANVLVDVTGVFVPVDAPTGMASAGRFQPLTPDRRLDTRALGVPVAAGTTVRVPRPSGVPADATALVVNLTATGSLAGGYLTAFAAGSARPGTSMVNTDGADQTRAATAIVPVSALGIDVFASSSTHLIVDVFGWFTGASAPASDGGLFVPVTPTRLFDTRPSLRPAIGSYVRELSADTLDAAALLGTIRPNASAFVFNTTVTDSAAAGYLTAFPARTPQPPTSSLNWEATETVANLTVSPNSTATVGFFVSVTTELIADLTGYFTGTPIPATLPAPPSPPPVVTAPPGRLPPVDATAEIQTLFSGPFAAPTRYDATAYLIARLRAGFVEQGFVADTGAVSLIDLPSEGADAVAVVIEVRNREESGDDTTPGYDLVVIIEPNQTGRWAVTSATRQTICTRGISWSDNPPLCV
jgi:hypothetical protein